MHRGTCNAGSAGVYRGCGKLFGIEQAMKGGLVQPHAARMIRGRGLLWSTLRDDDMHGNVLAGAEPSTSLEPADSARLLKEGRRDRDAFQWRIPLGGGGGQRAAGKNSRTESRRLSYL
jgi:hypothetical protein